MKSKGETFLSYLRFLFQLHRKKNNEEKHGLDFLTVFNFSSQVFQN